MSLTNTRDHYESLEMDESVRRRTPFGLLVNWLFILGILAFGFQQLERDWFAYKMELFFYDTIQDGMTVEDMDHPFTVRGIERNMKYKDSSLQTFFIDYWWLTLVAYAFCLAIPFFIGVWRLRKKDFWRLNVPYGLAMFAFISFASYNLLIFYEVI